MNSTSSQNNANHRRVWHPCHTHATLLVGAAVPAAPTKQTLHQHYNPPTEFTEFTESSGGEEPPTDFADAHRFFFSANNFFVLRSV